MCIRKTKCNFFFFKSYFSIVPVVIGNSLFSLKTVPHSSLKIHHFQTLHHFLAIPAKNLKNSYRVLLITTFYSTRVWQLAIVQLPKILIRNLGVQQRANYDCYCAAIIGCFRPCTHIKLSLFVTLKLSEN